MPDTYRVTLTFTEPLLGTISLNKDLYREFLASKAPNLQDADQEVGTVEEQLEKGTTGFHRFDGRPGIYDYAVKGYFKDACSMLARVPDTGSSKLRAYRKVIDGLLFVAPRQILLELSGELGILERTLRAQTAQGERVAIVRSEMAPAGTRLGFSVVILGVITPALLAEWLDYGALRGLGQFRNGGYGRFVYELHKA